MAWLPSSFAWGNFSVLAIGVWAVAQRDSIDAMLMVRHRTDPSVQAANLASCDTYSSLTIGTARRIRANLFVFGMWDILPNNLPLVQHRAQEPWLSRGSRFTAAELATRGHFGQVLKRQDSLYSAFRRDTSRLDR